MEVHKEIIRSCSPDWLTPSGKIDEATFCQEYLYYHRMIYTDGAFFTVDGKISDINDLRKDIYEEVHPFVNSNIARKVDSIIETMKLVAYHKKLDYEEEVIHVANGCYDLWKGFSPEKRFCRYRLPVNCNEDAPEPKRWLAFLDQLLEPEDIDTLQEYMGYCLVPTTCAQKMLLITGKGGEGKSRIGVVMKALMGDNLNLGSIAKVECSPFARADLQHLLVMVDDDLKMEALKKTNYLKSIITAEVPMDLERKGLQSYQGDLKVRFIAFGNSNLQALHDRSNGFFRRQIILKTKERAPDRVDDPYLAKKLLEELEGIFMWCLAGLFRLKGQNYQFTISSHARENLRESIADGCNGVDFMQSRGYFLFSDTECASSRSLYRVYSDWCDDNSLKPLSERSFLGFLKENAAQYGMKFTFNVPIGNGKHARGFEGIRLLPR